MHSFRSGTQAVPPADGRAMSKKRSFALVAVSAFLATAARATLPADAIPPGIFAIGNATVGVTTLDDVRKAYGSAYAKRAGRGEEANVTICYVQATSASNSYIEFESGVMGGYDRITGYRITQITPRADCSPTRADVGALSTANGIHLGQSVDNFRKSIPVEFEQEAQELVYKTVTKRKATPKELERLRARWPDEKEDHFDVTIGIRAKFRDNQLFYLYVHKIETY